MFLNHFQFTSQPFAERVSATALWQDDRMQQGLARLRYLAEQATVGLVIGASGVGKSALLKRFLHELHGPRWQPVYLHLTHLSAAGLLKLLVGKLGEVPRRGKERLFEQILGKARQAEGGLLVVLDEAHLIATEALTDIRLLISSALDDAPPLKVVLAGQEPLRQTLRQSLHADLLEPHLRAVPPGPTDQGADRLLHRLPTEAGRRLGEALRSGGQGIDPRLLRWRAAADQQSGHGLSVGRRCPKRPSHQRSHPPADAQRVPTPLTPSLVMRA